MKTDELNPKVVLGVAAHPDDLDFGASGTLAAFAKNGADVYYLILTDGSKGTRDKTLTPRQLNKIRKDEQRAAVKAINGRGVEFLDYPDGCLEITMELKKDIVQVIRKLKPDLVITMDPTVIYSAERGIINHPDHRAAGQATLDAIFPLARDHLSFPELYAQGFMPHKTRTILLTNFEKHNFIVDISSTFDNKIAALEAHGSQIKDIGRVEGWMREMAKQVGGKQGYELGEGFIRIDLDV